MLQQKDKMGGNKIAILVAPMLITPLYFNSPHLIPPLGAVMGQLGESDPLHHFDSLLPRVNAELAGRDGRDDGEEVREDKITLR